VVALGVAITLVFFLFILFMVTKFCRQRGYLKLTNDKSSGPVYPEESPTWEESQNQDPEAPNLDLEFRI
jgi:hypothetical protein